MLSRMERISELLDQYDVLLTDKQIEAVRMHFEEDLSYSEISEELSVSKAAAYDLVTRTEKILNDYEEKLKLADKYKKRMALYDKLENSVDSSILEELRELG